MILRMRPNLDRSITALLDNVNDVSVWQEFLTGFLLDIQPSASRLGCCRWLISTAHSRAAKGQRAVSLVTMGQTCRVLLALLPGLWSLAGAFYEDNLYFTVQTSSTLSVNFVPMFGGWKAPSLPVMH